MSLNASSPVPPVTGVCPVLETPFTKQGAVDEEGFLSLIDHVLSLGVPSVMFPGFASEFYKLSDTERTHLTELLLIRTRDQAAAVVVSIPDHSTYRAVAQARHAIDHGAAAINILPPHLLAPTPAAICEHLSAVLHAIAPTPALLQVAPSQTGTTLDATTIATIARRRSNMRQVKVESSPAGLLITALASQNPPIPAVIGYAGLHLPDALRRGVIGVQPGSSFVEIYQHIWMTWQAGKCEEASALHTRLLPYLSNWMQNVELIIAAEKAISQRRGVINSAHCRAPSLTLDAEEQKTIDRFLSDFADLLVSPAR